MTHEAPAFVLLALIQGIAAPRIGVGTLTEFELYGCADQVELFAEEIFQIPLVAVGYAVDLIAVNDYRRRIASTQVRITHLDAAAVHHRRRMSGGGHLQQFGQVMGARRGKRRPKS